MLILWVLVLLVQEYAESEETIDRRATVASLPDDHRVRLSEAVARPRAQSSQVESKVPAASSPVFDASVLQAGLKSLRKV